MVAKRQIRLCFLFCVLFIGIGSVRFGPAVIPVTSSGEGKTGVGGMILSYLE